MKTFFQLLVCSLVFAGLMLVMITTGPKHYLHEDGHVATVADGKIGRCILDCPGCAEDLRKFNIRYPDVVQSWVRMGYLADQ